MSNNRIFLSSPHMSDEGYEKEFIKEAFDTNWIAPLGENVNKFEKEIANYVNIEDAAALSSGTAGIHMALKSLNVKKDDIVFCSSLTFSASVNPIIYQGAIPVFIDSEKQTWDMDPKCLELAFEKYPNPKAVIVVHLYGQPANMDEIMGICNEHNVPVVEDAAESLGAMYKGKQTGTFGQFGIFSFNGNKIITTSGGGMVISNNQKAIEKIRFWATQARDKARHYQHTEIGYNYRMSNIVAGIGRGQLKVLNDRIDKKRYIYERYKNAFKDIEYIEMMPETQNSFSTHWLSTMILTNNSKIIPNNIMDALEKENIESRPVWKPMHMQPVFKDFDFIKNCEKDSISQELFENGICLPSDTKMTNEEQDRVIKIIRSCFNV